MADSNYIRIRGTDSSGYWRDISTDPAEVLLILARFYTNTPSHKWPEEYYTTIMELLDVYRKAESKRLKMEISSEYIKKLIADHEDKYPQYLTDNELIESSNLELDYIDISDTPEDFKDCFRELLRRFTKLHQIRLEISKVQRYQDPTNDPYVQP